jgi:hypothetical protein
MSQGFVKLDKNQSERRKEMKSQHNSSYSTTIQFTSLNAIYTQELTTTIN